MSFKEIKFKFLVNFVSLSLNALSYVLPKTAGRKAAELFGTPRKGRLTDNDRDRLKSATWQTLYFNDLPIQCYQWQGNAAKTVILVHGWESNAARWHALVKLLKKESFNIVALDAPAHGQTGSQYFDAVLYAQMLDVVVQHYQPQYFVGHSVGGYTIAYWIGQFGVKIHDFGQVSKENWAEKQASGTPLDVKNTPLSMKFVLMASPSDIGKVFNKYLDFIKANQRVRRFFYRYYEAHIEQKIADIKAEKMLKNLKINTLIIHDRDDDVIGFSEAEAIQHNISDANLLVTEKLGHRLRDNSVNQAVVDFLKLNN